MRFYALGFQGVSGWLEPYIKGVLFKIENLTVFECFQFNNQQTLIIFSIHSSPY